MPIQFVDTNTAPQGSLPASPIAGAFQQALGAYGRSFPTAAEQAEIRLRNVQTRKGEAELAEPKNLQQVFERMLTPQTSTNPDGTSSMASSGDTMRANLPSLIGSLVSEHIANAPNLALMGSSYMKGMPQEISSTPAGRYSTQDMAMMGAGHPTSATPGGVKLEHSLGTPEMRNREFRIQQIMNDQGATRQQASAIVDGVIEGGLDPVTRQPYVLNKLDLMNRAPMSPGMNNGGNAAITLPTQPPAEGAKDFLTQLVPDQATGPGVRGGEVPLTGGAATPAPTDYPTATAKDIGIDFNKAYGGGSAVGKLMSMKDALIGDNGNPSASGDIAKMNQFKSGYLGIVGQHPGFRNNAGAQGLTLNQLPDTGPVTDPEHIFEQALVKPSDATNAAVQAMNNVIQMRKSDSAIIGNTSLPPEERISAQNRIRDEDNFIRLHGSQELQGSYAQAAGIQPPTPTPQSNEQQMKAATTVQSKAPTRAEFMKISPGTIFPDAKGVLWEKQPDGTTKKVRP